MASITQYYGIPGPVPFEDVDVHSDNRRYIDPHLLRLRSGTSRFADEAVRCLDSFFATISRAVMSPDAVARDRALSILQQFGEPWETRLGMAQRGFSGHGGADDIGARIWETLATDLEALLAVGILKHLEYLPLFVQGVDNDITSDITTRIVFGPLADFTHAMLASHPQFGNAPHETRQFDRQVWDPTTREWARRRVCLPVIDDQALLLVPREWIRGNLLMSPSRFYETSLLSYVQATQAVTLPDGKVAKTPKDRLRTQAGLERGRRTNLLVTTRAYMAGDDLLEMFRTFVRDRFDASEEVDAA